MKYYLLSGMDKTNNYNFYGNIVERFKNELRNFDTIIYIPTYPEDKEKCFELSKSKKFENIGIKFRKSIVLDYSYDIKDVKKILDENDLIFLYGGDPYKQIDFIKKYKIKNLIKNKTIIALSAGSINMCKKAICTKDEDFNESTIYNGMELINFSIEPHFNIKNKGVLDDLKKFSNETDIYALEDSAYIIIEDRNMNFFGNIYLIRKGKIKKINS